MSKANVILGGANGQEAIGGAAEQAKLALNGISGALEAFARAITEAAACHARGAE